MFQEEDMISQADPTVYFILKGEVELYHKKSIRSKEITKLATLKVYYTKKFSHKLLLIFF